MPDQPWRDAVARILVPVGDLPAAALPLDPDAVTPAPGDLPAVRLLRPRDLVGLTFRFHQLALDTDRGGRPVLRARLRRRTDKAFLVVDVGPQHLLEQAFFEAGGDLESPGTPPGAGVPAGGSEVPAYPVRAVLSRSSRLAFRVSDEAIEYSEAGLLAAMRYLPLSVAPHAEAPTLRLPWLDLAGLAGNALGRDVLRRFEPGVARAPLAGRAAGRDASPSPRAGRQVRLPAGPGGRAPATPAAAALTLGAGVARARTTRTAAVLERRLGAASAVTAIGAGLDPDAVAGLTFPAVKPPPPRPPTDTETAIELPWRLQLSPHSRGAFAHAVGAVEHAGRVELWHSRLATRTDPAAGQDLVADPPVDEVEAAARTVRAIWTRDFDGSEATADFPVEDVGNPATTPPFRASLTARDRMQLVHLTSNHHWPKQKPAGWVPRPVPVENLALTASGGWLASRVVFPDTLPEGLSVLEWQHRATMGRDQFVKVVYVGVLLPFGHLAALVKVTERKVKPDGFATLYQRVFVVVKQPERTFGASGDPSLDNRMPFRWVRILTPATPPLALPVKLVPSAQGQVFVPTLVAGDEPGAGTVPFRFRVLASDVDDRLAELEAPMVFVEKTAFESGPVADVLAAANAAVPAYDLRGQRIAFAEPGDDGADPDSTVLATTSLELDAALAPSAGANFVWPFLKVAQAPVPAMSAFTGQSEPVPLRYAAPYAQHAFGPGNAGRVFLELATADGAAAAPPSPMGFNAQSDRSGGFLSPSVGVKGLARGTGPVGGDLASLASDPGGFDPGSMFGLDDAKLFGVIPLAELLQALGGPLPTFVTQAVTAVVGLQQAAQKARTLASQVAGAAQAAADDLAAKAEAFLAAVEAVASSSPDEVAGEVAAQDVAGRLDALVGSAQGLLAVLPAQVADTGLARPELEQLRAALALLRDVAGTAGTVAQAIQSFYTGGALPESVSARLDWSTELSAWPDAAHAVFDPKGDKRLRLVSQVEAPLKPGGSGGMVISCSLPPFALRLIGPDAFISLGFKVVEFSMPLGQKPDVNVVLDDDPVTFGGPLKFVNELKSIIPFDGFSDPPYLDVDTSGLTAGFDLAIPDLAVGVFALTNIHFGAELVVPFIGESLELRFFFAKRDDPFRLQVAFFAGGGFFQITVAPDGLRMIEASFEFGAAVAMNLVVASGSLSCMAGIYFCLELVDGSQNVQLTGYFRARGEVDVLGLISAAIELYLELTYKSVGGRSKAYGTASISIEVSVCFLSFSVTASCEKQFSGDKGDPTFVESFGAYTDWRGVARDPWREYCEAFAVEAA